MHDPYMEGFLTALLTYKSSVRYSPAAIIPTAIKLARQYEARSRRDPAWLTPATLTKLETAVKLAAKTFASRTHHAARARRRRELFYAMARRDAFRMVLGEVEPSALITSRLRPNSRVPAWRYEHKWRSAKREALIRPYQSLHDEHERARLALDRARAALSLTLSEKEFDLAGKRKAKGLNVRSSRETAQRVRDMREAVRVARTRYRSVLKDWRTIRDRKRKLDARIALLEQRIVEAQ